MKLRRAAVLLAVLATLPALACRKGDQGPRERPPPAVTSAEVTVRDVPVEIRSPVDLRPLEQADVGAKTIGYLDTVFVDRGDRVKRGQLLALVRPSELPDQLAAARGTLAQLQAQLALARANYERGQQLAPTGFVSQQDLQAQKTAVESAEAALAAAQSNVGVVATRLGETRIASPLDGWVSARKVDPGALVGPGSGNVVILTIQRMDTLRVFVPVNEREVGAVRPGQDANLELDALPGRKVHGTVVRVSPSLDPATRTADAEVQVPNAEGLLRPGMYGRAAIVTAVHRGAIVIPSTAAQITSGAFYAFVVGPPEAGAAAKGPAGKGAAGQGGPGVAPKLARVRRVQLEIGVDGGDWLEVTSGLSPGDEIVTAGIDVIGDGALVRAVKGVDPFTGRQVETARKE